MAARSDRSRSPGRFASDVADDDLDFGSEEFNIQEADECKEVCSALPWVPSGWSSFHASEIPHGPCTRADLHDWPEHQWRRLCNAFGEAAVKMSVQRILALGLFVTTHYSGMGTFEIMCGIIVAWLTRLGVHSSSVLERTFTMYAAADIDDLCVQVLGCHTGFCAPEHVFGDICHTLPVELVSKWLRKLEKYRRQVQSSTVSPSQRRQLIDRLGRAFVHKALAEMRAVNIPKNVRHFCHKHNRYCRHFPSKQPNGKLHVEAAGTTCVGFSPLGSNWRWLDDSCVAFLCWIALMWVGVPDIIVHECVPAFDPDILEMALNFQSDDDCKYDVRSICFSTRDQGVPIDRRRRYSVCTRIALIHINKYNLSYFSLVSFRRLEINGSIFFQAAADRLEQVKGETARARGLPAASGGHSWPWRALLTASENQMLQAICRNGVVDPEGEAFVTLSQNWFRQPASVGLCIPALTRNSKIYRMSPVARDERLAIADEYFGMQMMPMFLPEDHVSRTHFPEQSLHEAGAFKIGKARRLTGNGMNIEAVGSVFLFALATMVLQEP